MMVSRVSTMMSYDFIQVLFFNCHLAMFSLQLHKLHREMWLGFSYV